MEKLASWLWILVALVWLLPLIGVTALAGNTGTWIVVIAVAIIGIKGVMGK